MRLLVISHLEHYRHRGETLCGWPAVAREIDALADEFGELRHIACLHPGPPPAAATAYRSSRVEVCSVQPAGGPGWRGKLGALAAMWRDFGLILEEIAAADVVYVRTPANIAITALCAHALSTRKPETLWVKYAGEWAGRRNEPWSYRLQRAWLRSGLSGGVVTVNGDVAREPAHVFSMPNPSFTADAWREAERGTRGKKLTEPLRLVFAGRLAADKGALFAVQVCRSLQALGLDATIDLAGDGPQRTVIEDFIARERMEGSVRLRGWLDTAQLDDLNRRAHFVLLPSATEGWPKVLSEAMAFRAVPVASPVGAIPGTLAELQAGVVLPCDNPDRWAAEIAKLAKDSVAWKACADRAQLTASGFTYGSYLNKLRPLLRPTGVREAMA